MGRVKEFLNCLIKLHMRCIQMYKILGENPIPTRMWHATIKEIRQQHPVMDVTSSLLIRNSFLGIVETNMIWISSVEFVVCLVLNSCIANQPEFLPWYWNQNQEELQGHCTGSLQTREEMHWLGSSVSSLGTLLCYVEIVYLRSVSHR